MLRLGPRVYSRRMVERPTCGCAGAKSVLHLTFHHPLAYGIVLKIAFVLTWQLATALAAAVAAWPVAWISP